MNLAAEDVVYLDADILVDATGTHAEAIYIANGKVAAVGSNQDVLDTAGPLPKRVSLNGATVTPGLIDTHPHLLHFAAFEAGLVDLTKVRNHSEIVSAIRERASMTPKGDWIVTTPIGEPSFYVRRSWQDLEESAFPNRFILDQGSDDHPVMIRAWAPRTPNICGFNSLALRLLGITSASPSPTSKVWIDKDSSGEPTGILTGSVNAYYNPDPYWASLSQKLPPLITPHLVPSAVKEEMRKANERGITAIWEGHSMDYNQIGLYVALEQQSDLTLRVQLAPELHQSAFNEGPPSMEEIRSRLQTAQAARNPDGEWLRVDGITVVVYGSCWCGDMLWPAGYIDPWGNITRGRRNIPQDIVKMAFDFCAANNLRLHAACGGCYDVEEFLTNAKEAKDHNGIESLDWVLQHGYLEKDDHPTRLARLGISQTISMAFTFGKGDMFRERVGSQVLPMLNPLRSLLDAGVTTAASSDWGPSNPWEQMQLAVTHKMYPSGTSNNGKRQVITREQAFWMWTSGAEVLRWDGIGTLGVGNNADLIILDRNPIKCDLEQLPATRVHRTVVGGRVVHDDGTF